MLKKIAGRVKNYRKLTNYQVQFELVDKPEVVHLSVSTPWALDVGDEVEVVGCAESASGQFIGMGYRNKTKGVRGETSKRNGWGFIAAAILFFWGVFPLFTHLPVGIRNIKFNAQRAEALAMLD